MAKKRTRADAPTPWDRPKPGGAKTAKKALTPARKAAAKTAAKRAGRPYPNLVDNMREAAKQPSATKRTAKTRTATKGPAKKR